MRVIICGAGQVGYGIAERLSAEGNEITVIDNNPALVQRVISSVWLSVKIWAKCLYNEHLRC